MRLVTCPQCGHENRVSVVVTICDRCGEDISAVSPAEEARLPQPNRDVGRPAEASPAIAPAADQASAREIVEAPRGIPVSLVGRVFLAALAVAIGLIGSQSVRMGSAMASDPQIAGSIAILAVAAAVIGLVVLLVGSSSRQSEGLGPAVRAIGFLLACFGTLAAVALVTEGTRELPRVETFGVPDMSPPPLPMGPMLDPETGQPMPGFPAFQGSPPGPEGEGPEPPGMPQASPDEPPTAAGQPPG